MPLHVVWGHISSMKRVLLSAFILSSVGLTAGFNAAPAMARGDTSIPAEFPPLSYKGRQYVDSRGCVYIRASTGGLVDWIPRVTRTRDHICNAKPTFAGGIDRKLPVIPDEVPATTATAPKTAVARAPAAVTPKPAAPKVVARPAPKVAAAPVAKPQAKTQVRAQPTQRAPRFTLSSLFGAGASKSKAKTQTKPVVAATKPIVPPLRTAPPAPRAVVNPACGGGSALSQRYLGSGSGVRCGPQAQSPIFGNAQTNRGSLFNPISPGARVTVQTPRRSVTPSQPQRPLAATPGLASSATQQPYANLPSIGAGGQQRIAPRHVYEAQQNARIDTAIPEGYRPLWTDDRLNPKRAHQTAAGKAAMDLIWTQTVPRQLIDRASGRDVTRLFPGLQYPYTSMTEQARAQQPAVVSSKSFVAKPKQAKPQQGASAQALLKAYVQVATFAQPANAQRTAGDLAAKGLPMRIWTAKRGGKPVQLVVVGPFADKGQANAALSIVRRAGFGDAYLR